VSKKESKSLTVQDEVSEFLLYTVPGGGVKVEVILNNETIWLTEQRMADLFGVDRTSISRHLKNIFESNELDENMVLKGYSKITHKQAEEKALIEYEKFNKQQKLESDFDKAVKSLEKQHKKEISSGGSA
jgi:hypothetical protein